ncbi:MAG: beta-carotene 15,15'-monooxygenase [Actinomycetales bacterium]|nr:beta-carotene 15,15'-monooxygenase [Actinomycetales bacterium]
MGAVRAGCAGLAAAATTVAVRRALDRPVSRGSAGPGRERWTRVNHRGAPISLLAGPAVGAGVLVGGAVAGGRVGAAAVIAGAGGLGFGLIDDLGEDTDRARKGLRGHLGALARGELTTGGLKVLGIGATSVLAAAVLTAPTGSRVARGLDTLAGGALIAASANLVNLLDLRPGRALKAAGIGGAAGLAGAGGAAAAAVIGAAAAALPADLAERDMLGDGGANALGAVLGVAAFAGTGRRGRLALLAAAVGLTLASERVSFSEVIARTPGLRELDAWGRRA